MLTYVVRSYVNEELDFGGFKIRNHFYVEVPAKVMDALTAEQKADLIEARNKHRVSISLVENGLPVAAMNEAVVLQRNEDQA